MEDYRPSEDWCIDEGEHAKTNSGLENDCVVACTVSRTRGELRHTVAAKCAVFIWQENLDLSVMEEQLRSSAAAAAALKVLLR